MPDLTPSALQLHISERKGWKCSRRALPTSERSQTLLLASPSHKGPKKFNSLTKEVKSNKGCLVNKFKSRLGKLLKTMPDEPPVSGYSARYRASNSIQDQVALLRRNAKTRTTGGPA